MADASWKQFERRVAKALGAGDPSVRRRGADTSNEDGGKTDILHDFWGVECKLLKKSGHSDILAAVRQAERNSNDQQVPVSIVKRKGDLDKDALVSMRFETWLEWYASIRDPEPSEHPASLVAVPRSYCPSCGDKLVPENVKLRCETRNCNYSLICGELATTE